MAGAENVPSYRKAVRLKAPVLSADFRDALASFVPRNQTS